MYQMRKSNASLLRIIYFLNLPRNFWAYSAQRDEPRLLLTAFGERTEENRALLRLWRATTPLWPLSPWEHLSGCVVQCVFVTGMSGVPLQQLFVSREDKPPPWYRSQPARPMPGVGWVVSAHILGHRAWLPVPCQLQGSQQRSAACHTTPLLPSLTWFSTIINKEILFQGEKLCLPRAKKWQLLNHVFLFFFLYCSTWPDAQLHHEVSRQYQSGVEGGPGEGEAWCCNPWAISLVSYGVLEWASMGHSRMIISENLLRKSP